MLQLRPKRLTSIQDLSLYFSYVYFFLNSLLFIIYASFYLYCPYLLGRDKRPLKSLVVGRPILLALEDIDGSPSFLEKALQFIEKYGTFLRKLSIAITKLY